MEDERVEELGSLTAIYPELIIDEKDPFAANLEIPVTPSNPLLVRFLPTDEEQDTSYADVLINGAAHVERDVRLEHLPPLTLRLTLPDAYPADEPPKAQLLTQYDWLPKEKLVELEGEVANLWEEYGRCAIVFSYIDFLQQAAERGFDLTQSAQGCLVLPSKLESTLVTFANKKELELFNQGTYNCGICLEPKKGSACYRMSRCRHVFCKKCLQDFYNDAIRDGNVGVVECLDPDCGMFDAKGQRRRQKKHILLHPRELLAIDIEENMVRRYVEMKRKKKLESDKTTVFCPRTWCLGPARNPKYPPIPLDLSAYVDHDSDSDDEVVNGNDAVQEDGPKLFPNDEDRVAVCEKCQYAFCKVCLYGWHGSYVRCRPRNQDELQELSAEDQASLDYIAANTSPCPCCNAPVQKTFGCNHMQCFQCNTHFCYLCGFYLSRDNPYQHFNTHGTPCFQRLFELAEGDEGQGPQDGQGFGGARYWEQMAIQVARDADAADAEAAPQNGHAEPPR